MNGNWTGFSMLAVPLIGVSVLAVASSATALEPNGAPPAKLSASAPDASRAFNYSRASPAIRWPDLQFRDAEETVDWIYLAGEADDDAQRQSIEALQASAAIARDFETPAIVKPAYNPYIAAHGRSVSSTGAFQGDDIDFNGRSGRPWSRRIKLSKLALKKARDWRERVQRLSTAICNLGVRQSVADLLNNWQEQLAPTDMCFVLKRVGDTHWQRALELYEWLNLRHWYKPNFRMLAGILSVLGRVNQVSLAREIFDRAEPSVGSCVQVFNAMMSVYARQGNWEKVHELLTMMSSKGCEADLITYNTAINARCKAGLKPGMAGSLLKDMQSAGVTPDVVTYNTLISACISGNARFEAEKIFEEMKICGCEPDIWSYNAMISVLGRSGAEESANELFDIMQAKGFVPDAVTYNAILYAFAKSGRVEDVDKVRMQMSQAGCSADEITYNTMISMYGKLGLHDKALSLYHTMTNEGCHPDAVTFTILIDALGKAGLVSEAERVFAGMGDSDVRPTLQAFSAMICAYAKVGMLSEAERTYDCMLQTGIVPDNLAFCVMLEVFQRADLPQKGIAIYKQAVKLKFRPDFGAYQTLLQWFLQKRLLAEVEIVCNDLQHSGVPNAEVCGIFLRAGLPDKAAELLKFAVVDGFIPSEEMLLDVLNSYFASCKYSEAQLFIHATVNSVPQLGPVVRQTLIAMLAEAKQITAAKEELEKVRASETVLNLETYRTLIVAFQDAEMLDEVVQVFSDMQQSGVQPDDECQKIAAAAYCKLDMMDSAHKLVSNMTLAQKSELGLDSYVCLIEAYGKRQLWESAESTFRELQQVGYEASIRAWNALISAYGSCGKYQDAKLAIAEMIKAGKMPTPTTCIAMLQAVIRSGRLQDIRRVVKEMQQLGVRPSKKVFLSILNSSASENKVHVAKVVFQELKAAGYLPNMQVYHSLILLFTKASLVQDSESIVREMELDHFTPDIVIYNSMLSLYSKMGHYRKAAEVFRSMQAVGCSPDSYTFNALIWLYSRCLKVQEAQSLFHQMEQAGYMPDAESFTALISAFGRLQQVDGAEVLFKRAQESGCILTSKVFHAMMNVYRSVGQPEQVKGILNQMKTAGIEPNLGTFHVLMDSYGRGGEPINAEAVLDVMQEAGISPGPSQYTGVINAYLKSNDHDTAIKKLLNMKNEGFEPDYRTWTSIVSAASRCEENCEAVKLLTALADVGFPLPLRLLREKNAEILIDVDRTLQDLEAFGEDAGLGLINVLLDLLWGFQRRGTAGKIFRLAIQRKIYSSTIARVQVKNWSADLRRLSAGAALVALTLWLDQMQDAALQGFPESPKFVTLVTGCSRNTSNQLSVEQTIKVHLWTMGSPFLNSKIRTGVLVAKGHSLRMWLKDSSHCTNLELKNFSVLPEVNSMKAHNGAFMQAQLLPALQQIEETMGAIRPKKFCRLINLSEPKRNDALSAELQARKDKVGKGKGYIKGTKQSQIQQEFTKSVRIDLANNRLLKYTCGRTCCICFSKRPQDS